LKNEFFTLFQMSQKGKIDLNLKLICRDCRDSIPNIVEDFAAGDLICGNCGLVLGNRVIDTRSEWRTFANSDDSSGDPSRVGAAQDPLLEGSNFLESTLISGLDRNTGISKDLNRAHNKVAHDRNTQNLLESFKSIQHMADSITLPRIVSDSAKQLFKKVDDEKLLKGKSQDAIKAACIYIACKEHQSQRTFKEICNLTKVSKKEIGKCYKILQPLLDGTVGQGSLDSYVYRFCSQLDLGSEVVGASLKVLMH
jgi:transcription initiation factor TFIIB